MKKINIMIITIILNINHKCMHGKCYKCNKIINTCCGADYKCKKCKSEVCLNCYIEVCKEKCPKCIEYVVNNDCNCKNKCTCNKNNYICCPELVINDSDILDYVLWKYGLDKCKIINMIRKTKETELKLIAFKKFHKCYPNICSKSIKDQYKIFIKWYPENFKFCLEISEDEYDNFCCKYY